MSPILKFYDLKDIMSRWKDEAEWKQTLTNHKYDKEPIFAIYEEFSKWKN